MSISPFVPGQFSASQATERLTQLRAQLNGLQRQLGSGKKAETFAGLGAQRYLSLDARAKLAATESYKSIVNDATLRINLQTKSLEGVVRQAHAANSSLAPNSWLAANDGQTIGQKSVRGGLDEVIDLLNVDVAGRYLFSGRASDVKPVLDSRTIIEGDGAGRAGVKQLITERRLADLGAGDLGRLNLTVAAATIGLAEDGNPDFGFRLQGLTSSLSNTVATPPAGAPAALAVTFAGAPNDGETLTLTLRLPDGSDEQIMLTARTDPAAASQPGSFLIGATPAATAASFSAALQTSLQRASRTSLQAASAVLAARDFFAGSLNAPPRRVAGPPFATAAGFAAGTAANTVIWYRGDDDFPVNPTSAGARASQPARIDANLTIGTGAQANEAGLRDTLAAFAVAAAETFPAADVNARERYEALTLRIRRAISAPPGGQKPEDIAGEIALAGSAARYALARHRQRESFFLSVISAVEDVNNEEVAANLLSLQTRLEASYQTTAIIGRLTLTSYLR